MTRFSFGGRAPAFLAGLGITMAAAASGCWTPPTRTQNQTPAGAQRTNTNPGTMSSNPAMNSNPMAGSGAIPTPPGNGAVGAGSMNQNGMYPNGMTNNAMPANGSMGGMNYPNGGIQNYAQNGMQRPQPGLGNLTPPTANQLMTGTPQYMNTQPSMPGAAPIATNAGASAVQPATYQRPSIANAPMTNPIASIPGPGQQDQAPQPSTMNNRDPNPFSKNDRLPVMQTPADAIPYNKSDETPVPMLSSPGPGAPPLSPPPK